jgi:hypothetical protein
MELGTDMAQQSPARCPDGMKLAAVYEIDLPRERQPIADDRQTIPRAELASSAAKSDYEVEQVMRYLGWEPNQKRDRRS